MGTVYRATDDAGQPFAIKRLHAQVAASPDLLARFQREANVQSMLDHPNIVGLHAVGGTPSGDLFFVLEFVDGHDLGHELDLGPLTPARAINAMIQLLSALHYAHQFGLVHRDLKPENVLLAQSPTGERLKVIDFGLVKMLNDVLGTKICARLTQTGMIFGTPEYMAPEQIEAEEVDPRTDLYAVGVLLFESLTGRRPFEFEEVHLLWHAHLNAPVPTLSSVDPSFTRPLHRDLDAIIGTLMAKRPDGRFDSAQAARRALESLLAL